MKRTIVIITIALFLVSTLPALSIPYEPPMVYIKNITISSDIVKFAVPVPVDVVNGYTDKFVYEATTEGNTFIDKMIIDSKYDNSIFEIILLNGSQQIVMYNGNLSNLKLSGSSGNDTKDSLYQFPIQAVPERYSNNKTSFEEIDADISHFDNQMLIVKLNDTLVREYILGYSPGNLNPQVTSGYSIPNFFILVSFLLVLLVVIIIFLVKRRHSKRK
jgi:hypothetical protein